MLGETTALFFQTELRWPPPEVFDFRVSNRMIRGLFNKLFEPDFDEFAYQNIQLEAVRPTLSTHVANTRNVIQFDASSAMPSMAIEESKSQSHVDHFVKRVNSVLRALDEVAKYLEVEVPCFFLQRCRIQCLAQPHNRDGSLALLAGGVANVLEQIEPFERPPCHFGVRFRFPPTTVATTDSGQEQTHHNFATVRFETYARDPRQVWMEVASEYLLVPEGLKLADTGRISEHIRQSYDFLTNQCVKFLNQFDVETPKDDDYEEKEQS